MSFDAKASAIAMGGTTEASQTSIAVRNLTKLYLLYDRPVDRLKQMLARGRGRYYREFRALSEISFDVRRGHTVGIIGQNGSGKSTLLQLICGTLQPTGGEILVNGRVSALLELGAGFNPEFTGRNNVVMHGAIMGFTREQMLAKLPAIESFAEIGEFIDRPVKTYSSGMFVRLAFAAAVHVDPDILIVDEALAVGDIAFQHKCMSRMREFMQRGTVLFVSHDLASITSLCSEVIWLEHGRIREIGDPKTVTEHYWAKMYEEINRAEAVPVRMEKRAAELRAGALENLFDLEAGKLESFGTGGAQITGIAVKDANGNPISEARGGDVVRVHVTARAIERVAHPIIGLSLKDVKGNVITGTNTDFERAALKPMAPGAVCSVQFELTLPELAAGSYSLAPAIADGIQTAHTMLHWVNSAAMLQITNPRPVMGMARFNVEVTSNQGGAT